MVRCGFVQGRGDDIFKMAYLREWAAAPSFEGMGEGGNFGGGNVSQTPEYIRMSGVLEIPAGKKQVFAGVKRVPQPRTNGKGAQGRVDHESGEVV